MQEFTIHIESPQLNPVGADVDKAQAYANEAEPDSGAAFLIDHERGIFSATLQVESERPGEAVDRAIELFARALAAAGHDVNLPGWRMKLEVEGVEQLSA